MNHDLNKLEEKIISDGKVLEGDVLKVDSFLNHRIDTEILKWIGEELKRRFDGIKIDKILTIEASGIAIASSVALCFGVPLLFAKKSESVNVTGDKFFSKVYSFTHKRWNTIHVSAEYLTKGERVLIVDDILASGSAIEGLVDLVSQAGAEVAGVGICIEKSFQGGGMKIRKRSYKLESLAIVESMDNKTGKITFAEPK